MGFLIGKTIRGRLFSLFVVVGWLISIPGAYADLVFFDNFEDGDASGWQETITSGQGGSGSTGVESHNSSQMAYAYHQGKGSHSLSHDFSYVAGDILSFDMHAVANTGTNMYGGTLHSQSGVNVIFLDTFNVSLGSFSLVNATNPGSLGAGSLFIDNAQHDYTAAMSEFAAYAGLNDSNGISKISLDFFALADYHWGGNIYPNGISSATVWFDNVTVNPVPIPSTLWIFGSALCGLVGLARRKKVV